jgi:hypothetical protein
VCPFTITGANSTIAILGGPNDRKPWQEIGRFARVGPTVSYEYGRPLGEVVGVMRLAPKAVITVDSAGNRLAWVAGIPNHVLICADCVPIAWDGHGSVHMVHGDISRSESEVWCTPSTWRCGCVLSPDGPP